MELTWEDEYRVHSYEVDLNARVSLPVLCQYMQESAWNHAEHLKLGYTHLIKKGLVWVLSRQLIRIDTYPKWGQWVKVQTWPTGREKLFCFRDFLLLDESDNVVGAATSTWCVIDVKSRRPQRTDSYFEIDLPDTFEQAIPHKPKRIEQIVNPDIIKSMLVGYGDIDVNSHVNNVKYIEWILESFPLEFLKNNRLKQIEINYLSECSYGDEVVVNSQTRENNTYVHTIVSEKTRELCRAITTWT